jgi:hypothetical protein
MWLTPLFAEFRRMSLLLITMDSRTLKANALDNRAAGMKFGNFHFAYKLYPSLSQDSLHHVVK